MKQYLELEIKIILLTQDDVVTASAFGEKDKLDDPYAPDTSAPWWEGYGKS